MIQTGAQQIRLGLIGGNIARSRSPLLHRLAGQQAGIDVRYDLLVPAELGLSLADTFKWAQDTGYCGVNVTYPFKEEVTGMVTVADPVLAALGAVNTVTFGAVPEGFNTDYTGFKQAYRDAMGAQRPGVVCLLGTGGVGKAVAFGLLDLRAEVIRCVDLDRAKAQRLAATLGQLPGSARIEVWTDGPQAAQGADGIVNCTPLGMVGIGGTPLPYDALHGASWAFDAVYTPADTRFLADAAHAGLSVLSGEALFFAQGIAAWQIFTGHSPDPDALRHSLSTEPS